ncbi:MAG: uroporphyrinogen-III C-methyltransferase [Deltaproteobacteria bacterium]|nr:uroporphyrinogen-III C-methyltransferase [Deltaproteobacteria bacterium]
MKPADPYLPVFFDVAGAPVLVVGAGVVAERKIRSLLSRGAAVTAVAIEFSSAVRKLAQCGSIRAIRDSFRPAHLDGMALAFAATSDRAVNRSVSREAKRRGVPVNAADSPDDCSFILPAVVAGDEFTLAVSTAGRNPGAARAVREYLEENRAELAVRLERGRRRPASRPAPGMVFIVGAGPGDPDLLTVRALGLLRAADVVIHDYLVPRDIVSLASPKAKVLCYARRGRTDGHGSALKQDAIHAAMARFAREGKSVVRLKSGDPLVFGRGGEEAQFLASEGIPFEIVPGITAAVGCAASAGIPLTHRALASSVTFIAGHEADGKHGSAIDWARLPKDGTLAVYMGVGRSGELARDLVEKGGFPPETPVAIVENGTRRGQRVLRGTLDGLSRLVEEAGVRSPAVLFVGRSAGLAVAEGENDGSVAQGV